MTAYKWGGWLMIMSSLALAAPGQEPPASAVRAATAEKKVSTNPVKDYEEGLRLLALGEGQGSLDAFIDAAERFRLAADAGHAGAQARYGLSVERGQMLEEAIKYYRLSADQGHMDGQFGLGSMYLYGEGVTQDFAEARKWLTLAGEQGHKVALNIIAAAYLRRELSADELALLKPKATKNYIRSGLGLDESARRSPEALVWIQRAADSDSLPALEALALAYRSGQFGLTADAQKADAIVAKMNILLGITKVETKKRSALYRLLRGDDSEKNSEKPK